MKPNYYQESKISKETILDLVVFIVAMSGLAVLSLTNII